jgi:transposase
MGCRYNGKENIWRRSDEKYLPDCMKGTVKHDKKIMVWGCFCYDDVGALSRIRGIMDAKKYHYILQHRMRKSARRLFHGQPFIFQSDNDPKHTAKLNVKYLEHLGVKELEWPSQSPDLNPIENLWAIFNAQLKNRKCKNLIDLEICLKDAWVNIDDKLCASLVASMPKRCQAVIQSNGFPIKY